MAHDELVRRSGSSEVVWVGLRYGANLALAASAWPVKLARLILWDPLPNGREYLAELAESHAAYMRWELDRWEPVPDAPPQALGWPITDELRRALERLDISRHQFSSARHVMVILSHPDAHIESIASRMVEGQTTEVRIVPSQSPWNSDEALNSTLVPIEIVNAIIEAVKEPC